MSDMKKGRGENADAGSVKRIKNTLDRQTDRQTDKTQTNRQTNINKQRDRQRQHI